MSENISERDFRHIFDPSRFSVQSPSRECRGAACVTCFRRNYVPPIRNHEFAANRKKMSARLVTCTSLLQPTPHDSGDHVRPAIHPLSRSLLRLTGVYIHLPSRAAPVPDQNQRDIVWIPSWIADCRWRCRQTVYSPLYWPPFAPLALDRRAHIELVPVD